MPLATTYRRDSLVKFRRERIHPAGLGPGQVELGDRFLAYFAAARRRRKELERDPGTVEALLRDGATRARAVADQTIAEARRALGT